MDIGSELDKINAKYPWATEATLNAALSKTRATNSVIKQAIDTLKKAHNEKNKDLKKVTNTAKTLKVIKKTERSSISAIEALTSEDDPLGGLTDIFNIGAKAIESTTDPIMDAAKMLPGGWKALGWIGDAVTGGVVAATAVMSLYAKILTEQEAALRNMINYGLAVTDLKLFTEMRDRVAGVGISMRETIDLYKDFMPLYANLKPGIYNSINQFAALVTTISNNEDIINDYGYSNRELMRRLSEEADMMRKAGSLDQLDAITTAKLLERFKRSSEYTYALAEMMGLQRNSINDIRREANDDIDFRVAMSRAASTMAERFGEGADENVRQFNEELRVQLTTLFGPEFTGLVSDTMNRALYDFPFDTEFLNNMSGELNTSLLMLGDDARSQFISIMQDGITGSLKGGDLFKRLQDFTLTVKETPPLDTPVISTETELVRNLQARANIAPDNFLYATRADFESLQLTASFYSETADDVIDGMDGLRVAFRELIDSLEPDYENSTRAIETFGDIAFWLTNIFKGTFGFDTPGQDAYTRSGTMSNDPDFRTGALIPGGADTTGAIIPPGEASDLSSTGSQAGATTGGYTTGQIPAMRRVTPEGMGGNVIEAQSGATVRKGPISQDLMNVLQAAAAEIGVDVRVNSGGQMSMADYQAATGTKTNTGGDSPTYYLNGVAVRKGSTRHDGGGAADLNLVNPQTDQNYDFSTAEGRAVFANFAGIARQLGATGIGAGEGYMGTQTMHVGFGAEATWGSEGTSGFLADVYANTQVGTRSLDDPSLRINEISSEPTYTDEQIMDAFHQHQEYLTAAENIFFDEDGNIRNLTPSQVEELRRIDALDEELLKTFSDAGIDITPLGFGASIIQTPSSGTVTPDNDNQDADEETEDHSSLSPALQEYIRSQAELTNEEKNRMAATWIILQELESRGSMVS